ncbi:MAG: hypothetical protein BGP04_16240 [Rhizobiales bacterium 62-17]|nr:ABC transporter substrate-binding protein [Hyphomicrobiales bacterium]OJY03302.1 MAG: hypothetical protein BGP04_16240 [Rhizobiales bacterium 62-17]
MPISARLTRRTLLRSGAATLATPALTGTGLSQSNNVIKIGFVTPQTGALAAFGGANAFLIAQVQQALRDGLMKGRTRYRVDILTKDSQSNSTRAAEVTAELILRDKVDLILTGGAPDTVNAVSDRAEVDGVPCIATACPWQPWFFGRSGNPTKGFDYTWLFCFGLEDILGAFIGLWAPQPTNKVVACLFANDADGNAWGENFPPALKKAGFTVVEPGRYQPMSNDFTAQIGAFKAAGAEIVTGTMIPPDFATFWTQAAQQGFRPKIATIGKAFLFPAAVSAFSDRAQGLSCEVPWSSDFPFKSGLTGQNGAALLAAAQSASGGRDLGFILGLFHALFEVGIDALKRAPALTPDGIVAAIRDTSYESIVGRVDWKSKSGPIANVSRTPIVAGQWERAAAGTPLHLAIKSNAGHPDIPVNGTLKLL